MIQDKKLDPQLLLEIRRRLVRMHYESGVGHAGGNLSAIDALALLFKEYIGKDDHFVLSKGHSAGALYVALWSAGKLPEEALSTFHKDDTLLAGHPPAKGIKDIMFATGSLGHGLSLATGTALALRLGNKEGRVFCLTSDGEWQEGSTWEALIFTHHQQLTNLTVLIDHNQLQGFGTTTHVASMAPLWEKLRGFDIELDVVPGHNLDQMRKALDKRPGRPHFIFLETTKGKGVSFMEDRMEWHYLPLTEDNYKKAIEELTKP